MMISTLLILTLYSIIGTIAFNHPRIIHGTNRPLRTTIIRATTVDATTTQISASSSETVILDNAINSVENPVPTAGPVLVDSESMIVYSLEALNTKTVSIYRDLSYSGSEKYSELGKKQNLLFLPGLDGIGNYSAGCVGKLNDVFNVWKMATTGDDRSTFMELAAFVIQALEKFDGPVILVGESFGGLLASYVALRAKKGRVEKLILINPATSFDRTNWNLVAPIIANTGAAFPVIGISALLATAVDIAQIRRIGSKMASLMTSPDEVVKFFNFALGSSKYLLDSIPPEALSWRISKWFGIGISVMKDKYSQITAPTLILIGKNDRLLPSSSEGKRLKKEMTGSAKVQVKEFDVGHALLEDGFVDFTDIILKSDIFAVPKEESLDCAMPSEKDMEDVEKQYGAFINALSPVFLTRGPGGQLVRGLQDVPTGTEGRPVLLVGNHQLYGADLAPLIRQFITEKNTLVRGLAHPAVFAGPQGAGSGQMSQFKKFGAVSVSPTNIFELLKRNETVLLFPGGAKEALHGKGEEYKLFWPEKVDFVRMAGLMDAIIVPFSAVGISDSVNILFDQNDIRQIPFMRERTVGSGMPSARAGVVEDLLPPFFVPKAPERNYFLFGQPFDTRELNIYNKKDCKKIYGEVKGSVEDGLQTLLRFRESDPYREFVPRAIYEYASGGKQAPTAPLNLK